ncbi:cobyrinic acid ac-diamide synthase [Undibacterium sp. Ji67W]|uniref:cobyrinic acid ac-diamide synthase n=1 Tax=Undibacterium sp. Ji67W TaxID=3413042 RepID=UPI003BEFCAEA
MIIAFANEQINSGKSILAQNFASLCAYAGRKVLLVDSSAKRKSYQWGMERSISGVEQTVPVRAIFGKGLEPELENLSLRYKDIVIDTEGRDCMASRSALAAAKLVIIPLRAGAIDLGRHEVLIGRIQAARMINPNLRVLVIVTRADQELSFEDHTAIEAFVAKIPFAKLSATIVHEESAIGAAVEEGLSAPECTSPDNRAVIEMLSIYREVFENDKQQIHPN